MRLFARISFLIAGIALSIGVLSLLATRNVFFRTMQGDIEDKASIVAEMLGEHITPELIESEVIPVQEALKDSISRTEGVAFVYVTGFDGNVFAHTFQGGFPRALIPRGDKPVTLPGPVKERYAGTDGPILVVSRPLIAGTRGAIHVGMDESLVYRQIDRVRVRIVGITLGITFLGILLGVLLSVRITGPLGQLARSLHAFGEGKPAGKIDCRDGGLEVSTLAASFNGMIQERGRIEESLTWEAGVSTAVAQLASALVSPMTIKEITSLVVDQAKRLTGSAFGYAGHIDPRTGQLVVPTLSGEVWDECRVEGKELRIKEPRGLCGWGLVHKDAVIANSPVSDPRSTGTPPGHLPIRRYLSAPALVGEALVGQVAVANAERDYGERDVELMGRLAALFAIAIERRRAEETLHERAEQLRQSQKMEAVGKLAGGVAHDFNNLLTVILGYSNLLLARAGVDDPARREVEEIRNAGLRAASLTRQLLAFSRKQVLQPKVLDLNSVVDGMKEMLRRLIGEDIQLDTALAPDLRHVKADPGQIEQVIANLVVNARDAMPGGGRLTIATQNVELGEIDTRRHISLKPGSYALLSIGDTGSGMSEEARNHLFEPFFTTKEKGTGLGLSTVYGIVQQSDGHVWLCSEEGKGTTVTVCLPIAAERIAEAASAAVPKASVDGWETILLVEDETGVRELAREVLGRLGYVTLEAIDGNDALDIAEHHEGRIHLMLTDVVMPRMGGRELAARVGPIRPDMKILYMSGYTDDAIVRRGVIEPDAAFLQKPFTPAGLARKVRDVLGAPTTPGFPCRTG